MAGAGRLLGGGCWGGGLPSGADGLLPLARPFAHEPPHDVCSGEAKGLSSCPRHGMKSVPKGLQFDVIQGCVELGVLSGIIVPQVVMVGVHPVGHQGGRGRGGEVEPKPKARVI